MSSREMSDFSRVFAAALRGVMSEHGVRQSDIAARIGYSEAYVSGRLSGKKAIDTDILDAVGQLADLDTVALMAEMTRRMAALGDPSARRTVGAQERAKEIVAEARAIRDSQRDEEATAAEKGATVRKRGSGGA